MSIENIKFYLKFNNLNDKGRKIEDLIDRALNFITEKNAKW